ncbi:MAG: hypothetical protein ACXVC1_07310 [Tumebacillaceae bacterium]
MRTDRDGIRSALQADFEASTDKSFGLLHAQHVQEGRDMNMAENKDAMQSALNAAKQAAEEEGMASQVEELANALNVATGNTDEDGNGVPLAAKDGFRADFDDSSDL